MYVIRYCILLLGVIYIFFTSGCRKEPITHSVQGQLFSCGSNIPFANQRVAIYQASQHGSSLILRGKGETDAEGRFSFDYSTTQVYNRLEFVLGEGESVILGGLGTKEDITNLNIYRLENDIVTPLVVSLNVQNPYTITIHYIFTTLHFHPIPEKLPDHLQAGGHLVKFILHLII